VILHNCTKARELSQYIWGLYKFFLRQIKIYVQKNKQEGFVFATVIDFIARQISLREKLFKKYEISMV